MLRMFAAALLAAFAFAISPAFAGETFDCSLTAKMLSGALFQNSGGFATSKGSPAVFTILDCQHKATGFYANIFADLPMHDWQTGREVDLRLGWRGKVGIFDNDTSVAVYRFGVGPGPGNMWTTWDARTSFSYTYQVSGEVSLTPYAGVDLQRVTALHKNDFAVFGGAVAAWSFAPQWTASIDAAVWHHFEVPYLGYKKTVLSATATLKYDITKNISIGPQYIVTSGGFPGPHHIKQAVGFFVTAKF